MNYLKAKSFLWLVSEVREMQKIWNIIAGLNMERAL